MCEEFIVDLQNAIQYHLLEKRQQKYEVIEGKMRLMKWTEEALIEKKTLQKNKYKMTYEKNKDEILQKAKEKYKVKHPDVKHYQKKEDKQLNYYLSKKLKTISG